MDDQSAALSHDGCVLTIDMASAIIKPTEVVIEAFDAALSGQCPGERQGTVVAATKVGRNEPCPCGSARSTRSATAKLGG
jgi:uncharacterized protein YecA (UPF0149 family)